MCAVKARDRVEGNEYRVKGRVTPKLQEEGTHDRVECSQLRGASWEAVHHKAAPGAQGLGRGGGDGGGRHRLAAAYGEEDGGAEGGVESDLDWGGCYSSKKVMVQHMSCQCMTCCSWLMLPSEEKSNVAQSAGRVQWNDPDNVQ